MLRVLPTCTHTFYCVDFLKNNAYVAFGFNIIIGRLYQAEASTISYVITGDIVLHHYICTQILSFIPRLVREPGNDASSYC